MGAEHVPASPSLIASTIKLRKAGTQLPRLGFGVYQSKSPLGSTANALAVGYRHIDTARVYTNEEDVLKAVHKFSQGDTSKIPNEGTGKVWLTSKVVGKEHGEGVTSKAVQESVDLAAKYGLKWDLFLLHDPTAGKEKRLEAWKALIEKRDEGKLGAIGVSNFSEKHLQEIKDAGLELPDVNQIELHPFLQQKPIVEYCKKEGIVVEAYCPILRGQRFDHEVLVKLSEKYSVDPARILLRWSLQRGFVPLVKSDTLHRIETNRDLEGFELSEEEMGMLDGLDEGEKGAVSWNPVGHE
ncbi:hypothetical protein JCM8547_002013 [Rhodosporidiobolus lusitaniae]